MPTTVELISLIFVGILWGCTNPLLRKGSSEAVESKPCDESLSASDLDPSLWLSIIHSLAKFRHIGVWLPYALNQAGSLLFYFTLSQSDLSVAVPTCNALALVFSVVTSRFIGEKVDRPFRTIVGSMLVMGGVALCLQSKLDEEQKQQTN